MKLALLPTRFIVHCNFTILLYEPRVAVNERIFDPPLLACATLEETSEPNTLTFTL